MVIDKLNSRVAPLLATIIQLYCHEESSIPCLVGFKLVLNGSKMTEIGGHDAQGYSPIILNTISQVEVTYEDFCYFLSASQINLVSGVSKFVEVEINSNVSGYTYTHKFTDIEKEMLLNGVLCIHRNDDITSSENKFDLNGPIKDIELELLFVKRNELAYLPVEFNGFRKYKDWLTFGKSISPIADVTVESSDTLSEIKVELRDGRLEETLKGDLQTIVSKINF